MQVARIEMLLAEEENKRSKWKQENIRRRHNYLPLIMELLRSLASRGELLPIYQQVPANITCLPSVGPVVLGRVNGRS